MDPNSPFEIFVRELVAMDGVDSSEITLIDSDGCPTEHFIMGPLYKAAPSGKVIHHMPCCRFRQVLIHFVIRSVEFKLLHEIWMMVK